MSVANDELSDQEILEIYNKASYERKNGTDFHFSLKNKVGGLARALRVFQQNGLKSTEITLQLGNKAKFVSKRLV